MKKINLFFLFSICAAVSLIFSSCSKDETELDESIEIFTGDDFMERRGGNGNTGNGSLSGSHYTLNLIGVPKEKTADMTGNNGSRIFVPLEGQSKVMLVRAPEGEGFDVIDANGTDGRAEFQLPAPTDASYTIYARSLGTPGGNSSMTTCGTDPVTGADICSLETEVFIRSKGGSKFADITKNLVTITAPIEDLNGDGIIDNSDIATYDIFDEVLEDYFWQYDNNGLKLLQLRFYYN